MTLNELVSIVVPVYNSENYLHRCLESIAAQTWPQLEVILVDDGSTDGSSILCDQWAAQDRRFRVIHQQNRGVGAARNTGMDQALGTYIFFFDSDDYVDPRLVETCLKRAGETGAEVVLYGSRHVSGNSKPVPRPITSPRTVYRGAEIRQDLLPGLFTYAHGMGVSAWGKMYDLFFLRAHSLRFPEERSLVSEDGWFMLRLFSKVSTAAILPECLYTYCRRTDSLSRKYEKDRQRRNDEFLRGCMDYVSSEGLPEEIRFHIQSRYHGMTLGTLMQLLRSEETVGEKRSALREICRDCVLAETLTDPVLALDAPLPRLFWRCLRRGWYPLCTLLLYANWLKQAMGVRLWG